MEEDIKQAAALLRRIRTSLENMEINESLETINVHRDTLQYELCCIAKMFVPTIHQKIDEIIEVGRRKEAAPESKVAVSEKQHGADLIENGVHTEFKASVISAKSKYKCNFMWNIPSGATTEERRNNLLKSVEEKTRNGSAIFEIKDQRAKTLKTYQYSSAFLIQYFSRIAITPKTTKYNFGCNKCPKCDSFHRLDRIKQLEMVFVSNPTSVTEIHWQTLLNQKVDSVCK